MNDKSANKKNNHTVTKAEMRTRIFEFKCCVNRVTEQGEKGICILFYETETL